MILVSACLLGENCKYNGGNNKNQKVLDFLNGKEYKAICPEVLGGLDTPRDASEIKGNAKRILSGCGKVVSCKGKDVTDEFLKGAKVSLEIAKSNNSKIAILKAKSPSCGKGTIYDGSFSGKKISGNGLTAQLLMDNGIDVFTEEEI